MNGLTNIKNINWKLIFYHNVVNKEKFQKGEELFYHNSDYTKYSILGVLNDRYKINDYFEFVLRYEYEALDTAILHWRQRVNPIKTNPGDTELGYEPINVSEYTIPFGGLAKSSQMENTSLTSPRTYIDGTPGEHSFSNWWYSVCSYELLNNNRISGVYTYK